MIKVSSKFKKGFSLIEVLISLAVITFLLLGTAHSIVFTLKVDRRSSIKIWATELALAKIEYLKSISFDHPHMENGSYEEEIKVSHSQEVYLRTWEISDLSHREKKVDIDCRAVNERTIIIKFSFILSKELGF
ncbi:MAG: prepilin-type N-terminal cleavage/methylation domain-containing protein [Candidatus Aminicenantes bacterium]|nr:prepilin-type N-terminal cleavage/methylation domain-containing protein [Candidatus Aminicenantes bacterium]